MFIMDKYTSMMQSQAKLPSSKSEKNKQAHRKGFGCSLQVFVVRSEQTAECLEPTSRADSNTVGF